MHKLADSCMAYVSDSYHSKNINKNLSYDYK